MNEKRNLHGVILLDKPAGMSSNQALQKVKYRLKAKKAGHTGSLDPLATGLLPICLGQATKVSEYLLGSSKRYETLIKLGETTDTLDAEGELVASYPVQLTEEKLQLALEKFRGEIEQIPPMFSALKKNGQPLYKLARRGVEVERAARKMTVHELIAQRVDETHIHVKVHCSSGFYIRSLADDLGRELGCGGHVVELRRTAIKALDVAQSVTLEQIEECAEPQVYIQPIDVLISDFAQLTLSTEQAIDLQHGRTTPANGWKANGFCRFYAADGTLLAVGEVLPHDRLKMRKLFVLETSA